MSIRPFHFGKLPPLHPNDPAYDDYYPPEDDDGPIADDEEE